MTEREKVIKGLMCIAGDVVFCAHCKYSDVNGSGRGDRCKRNCAKDALALLKGQEPVAPIQDAYDKEDDIFRCGACGAVVGETFLGPPGECEVRHNYCPECGKAVKWE